MPINREVRMNNVKVFNIKTEKGNVRIRVPQKLRIVSMPVDGDTSSTDYRKKEEVFKMKAQARAERENGDGNWIKSHVKVKKACAKNPKKRKTTMEQAFEKAS